MTMLLISRIVLLTAFLSAVLAAVTGSSRIIKGDHPKISYYGDKNGDPLNDMKMRYKVREGLVQEYTDVPRYFLFLPDEAVEDEVEHRVRFDRWTDRVILEKLYFSLLYGRSGMPTEASVQREPLKFLSAKGWKIFDRDSDYCEWEGITCKKDGLVTDIRLDSLNLQGTLPHDLQYLEDLEHIDLKGNMIEGTIPFAWGTLSNLKSLCLAVNRLDGKIPGTLAGLTSIEHIWLSNNDLSGTIPENMMDDWKELRLMDFSGNSLRGMIPPYIASHNPKLMNIFLENNRLTGGLPEDASGLKMLQVIDVGSNRLSGTIPTTWMSLPKLRDFNVAGNRLSGAIPTEVLRLTKLEVFVLSDNRLTGAIPRGDDIIPGVGRTRDDAPVGGQWSDLSKLRLIMLNNNKLTGILPPELLYGVSSSLKTMDIGNNTLVGIIPAEIGKMSKLERIDAQANRFTGTLPSEMNRMDPNINLNLTGNLLVGSVPKLFCGGGSMSANLLYRQFGCDAILCPAGTFHPYGAATLRSGCRPCPIALDDELNEPPLDRVLGRIQCPDVEFVHGDLNGDGILSSREILRLLYVYTIGHNWGAQFQTWADPKINECDLTGIVCVNGAIAKIDLTDAAICTNGERKAGPIHECRGLPSELALLTQLEVLTLNRRQFLRGTIPTELGDLSRLKYLDISSCPSMTGPLPSELGRLTNLKYLNLGGCRFNGTVPEELYLLTNLEKLHLSMNTFTGTISPKIGNLKKLKEVMFSRTQVSGSIPEEIGELTKFENLEMYGNQFTGNIPSSLGNCTNLKRIDLFNNKLTGTIPDALTRLQSLQILHVKLNKLTGTISPKFGDLPFLSWFDVSSNRLHGTIPATFGASRSIKDFRLGGNMIYEPVPQSLCTNTNVNGGLTRMYGCDGVICPLGTYSDPGHATHSEGCKPCPEGETTMYLGSSACESFSEADILSIFFDVMGGQTWNAVQKKHWKDSRSSVCKWEGVTCNDEKIESIRFPLLGVDEADVPDREVQWGDFSILVPRVG